MLDHRGPVNTVLDINARFGVTAADRAFGLSSLSFDLSVYDIFGPLAVGGAIVLPSSPEAQDAQPSGQRILSRRDSMELGPGIARAAGGSR